MHLKHSSQESEDSCILIFALISPRQHNQPASLSRLQMDTTAGGTQLSWVTFTYIHSKVPQGTDLLPLLWESPSCSKTKGRRWQDQGNRMLKQHSRYRCVLSQVILFTVLGLLLTQPAITKLFVTT